MRNGTNKHFTREEINRRFRTLSESNEDLLTPNGSYQDFCKVIDRHRNIIFKNLKKNKNDE